jgi:hypothetical protein
VDLEAAAHPALDALTRKVPHWCITPNICTQNVDSLMIESLMAQGVTLLLWTEHFAAYGCWTVLLHVCTDGIVAV